VSGVRGKHTAPHEYGAALPFGTRSQPERGTARSGCATLLGRTRAVAIAASAFALLSAEALGRRHLARRRPFGATMILRWKGPVTRASPRAIGWRYQVTPSPLRGPLTLTDSGSQPPRGSESAVPARARTTAGRPGTANGPAPSNRGFLGGRCQGESAGPSSTFQRTVGSENRPHRNWATRRP